jgi:hypothetical protein
MHAKHLSLAANALTDGTCGTVWLSLSRRAASDRLTASGVRASAASEIAARRRTSRSVIALSPAVMEGCEPVDLLEGSHRTDRRASDCRSRPGGGGLISSRYAQT